MKQQPRGKGDDGFTLPEVLITVVMLGAIMTALASALIVTIGPNQQAADRLVASHDGQLLALHLPQDLQSASPTPPGTPLACSATGTANVLNLQWSQSEPEPTTTYAVSYWTDEPVPGEWRLIRCSSINGGAVSLLVVAHDLANGSSAATASVNGSIISITVTERTAPGHPERVFTVSGSRRTPATSAP